MAATDIIVDKATLVRISVAVGSDSFIDLGYTRNQAIMELQPFWADVHNDRGGGDEGMPVDSQSMGAIYRGRVELTTFDASQADNVRSIIRGGNAGQFAFADVGNLLVADTAGIKVNFKSANRPITFQHCKVETAEWGKGTKHSTLSVEIESIIGVGGVFYTQINS